MSGKIIELRTRRDREVTAQMLIAGRLRKATQFAALAQHDVARLSQALAGGHALPIDGDELAKIEELLAMAAGSLELLRRRLTGEETKEPSR